MAFYVTIELAMHPDVFGWLMILVLVSFVEASRAERQATHKNNFVAVVPDLIVS